MIAEGKLDRLTAQGHTQKLVTETDTEDRFFADKFSDLCLYADQRLRITGAVTEEDTIRIHSQRFICRKIGRHDSHIAAGINQAAQNVVLDAEVLGHNLVLQGGWIHLTVSVRQIPLPFSPVVGFIAADAGSQIEPGHARHSPGLGNQACMVLINS